MNFQVADTSKDQVRQIDNENFEFQMTEDSQLEINCLGAKVHSVDLKKMVKKIIKLPMGCSAATGATMVYNNGYMTEWKTAEMFDLVIDESRVTRGVLPSDGQYSTALILGIVAITLVGCSYVLFGYYLLVDRRIIMAHVASIQLQIGSFRLATTRKRRGSRSTHSSSSRV